MSYVLGLASNGTDSAACIFEETKLLYAVEEERFTRIKNSGNFPKNAIQSCLDYTRINAHDISSIGVSWDYLRYQPADSLSTKTVLHTYEVLESEGYPIDWTVLEKHLNKFRPTEFFNQLKESCPDLAQAPIRFYPHHECHAVSAYCFSGFEHSLVLIMDEKGEDTCTSVYLADQHQMRLLARCKVPNSLGLYYAAATQFLGFTPFQDEGTVMALASHGQKNEALRSWLLTHVFRNTPDEIKLDPQLISSPVFRYPRSNGLLYTDVMLATLSGFGIKQRFKTEGIEPRQRDFAFAVQDALECTVLEFVTNKLRAAQTDCLCIAGGLGLNCSLNGKIVDSHCGVGKLFVPPWSHDAGGAIGAAVLALRDHDDSAGTKLFQFGRLQRADWGPEFKDHVIERALLASGIRFHKSARVTRETAELLAQGRIVGWFQGRAEFGPRALGQRSILCHPANANSSERLRQIKRRLSFRPFAPSILEEHAAGYFSNLGANTEFMTTAFRATDTARREIPCAINEANGTLRAQTVGKSGPGPYRQLLEEFQQLTEIPALLNTSFNIEEPAVLTPDDAISTFGRGKIDALAIGDFLVINPECG